MDWLLETCEPKGFISFLFKNIYIYIFSKATWVFLFAYISMLCPVPYWISFPALSPLFPHGSVGSSLSEIADRVNMSLKILFHFNSFLPQLLQLVQKHLIKGIIISSLVPRPTPFSIYRTLIPIDILPLQANIKFSFCFVSYFIYLKPIDHSFST